MFIKRKFLTNLVPIMSLITAIMSIQACEFREKNYYKGPISNHFDGKKFFNPDEKNDLDFHSGLFSYWKAKKKYEKENGISIWPAEIQKQMQIIPVKKINDGKIHATFVGHSTFLLQFNGLNILTDPVWSERASPFSFMGPKRIIPPAISFEDLPKIDAVVVSHSHYDHMDIDTIKMLIIKHNPKFFVGLGTCHYFNQIKGLKADCYEMDWNTQADLKDIKIHFLPAKHWSKRALIGHNAMLWGAFAIETSMGNIYFAGDTAYGTHFKEAGTRFNKFKLALLPIGAYKPAYLLSKAHISPGEAVQAHIDLKSQHSVAMHFATFKLGLENYDDPVKDLVISMKDKKIEPDDFSVLKIGEEIVV